MAAVPGDIDTASGPPTVIPLRHFVVGFGFLLAAAVVGVADSVGIVPGMARAGYRHLLFAGWVCLTIMGAMMQFVPVWSGVSLRSQQLATAHLCLMAAGVAGLATGFLTGFWVLLLPAGAVLLWGIWTFVYNLGRTLARVDTLDVTEQHFAIALCWFALLTPFGISLASGLGGSVQLPLPRSRAVVTHVTVAVFDAVLTTVIGAIYKLDIMFIQT